MAWIGDQIPVHPSEDDLIGVERAAGRRVRRRRAMTGLIGAGVLVVGGVIAVNVDGDDGPADSIALTADEPEQADDEEESGSDGTDADDADTDTDSDGTDDGSGDVDEVADDVAVEVGDGAGSVTAIDAGASAGSTTMATAERTTIEQASAPGEFSDARIVAWQDGFLSLETRFSPQPLPAQFSEDIAALFPPEVVELIESEQPATINEATTLLSEAGLLDEVTQVLADHPEASDAIYAVDAPAPETIARFSRDGEDWQPVDLAPPLADWFGGGILSDGERLVLWELVYAGSPESSGPLDPLDPPSGPEMVRLASTTDLGDWQVVEVPITTPGGVPDGFVEFGYPSSVAVDGDRFVIEVDRSVQPDLVALFADDLADRADALRYGMGSSVDDTGVSIELYTQDGVAVERFTRTWDELGMEPKAEDEIYQSTRTVQVGSFDGTVAAAAELDGYGTTVGIDGVGFLRVGLPTYFSVDGVEWAEVDTLGGGGDPVAVILQHEGRVIAFGADGPDDPGQAFELDLEDLLWRPTSGPTVPAHAYPQYGSAPVVSSAVLYQVSEPYEPEPFESSASIEVDGYTFTQTRTHVGEGYSLARDGVEIVSEYLEWRDMAGDESGPFAHRRFEQDGSVITDPDTGDVLVTITGADQRQLWLQLDAAMPVDDTYVEPETRLLATDGERWLDEQLVASVAQDPSEMSDTMPRWPMSVAVNGDLILVAFSDGSIERFEF